MATICLAPSVVWPQDAQTPVPEATPARQRAENPWDNYSPVPDAAPTALPQATSPSNAGNQPNNSKPAASTPAGSTSAPAGGTSAPAGNTSTPAGSTSAPQDLGIPSGVTSHPATAEPSQLTNPWDRYSPIPELDDSGTAAPDSRGQAGTPSSGDNPWDAYSDGDLDSADDLTDVELPEPTGDNPWDKYVPAKRKAPVVENKPTQAGQPAKKVEEEKPLELATPLPVRAIPKGAPIVRNSLPVGRDNFFAIEYGGQLVGYSRYKVESLLHLGGTQTYTIASSTRIKVGMSVVEDLKFSNKLQLKKATLTPESFFCDQRGVAKDGEALNVSCIYSNTLIAQQNKLGENGRTNIQDLNGAQPHLIFNNLWGSLDTFAEHYWLLVRSASNGGVIDAYDPILRGLGKLVVYAPVKETWTDKSGRAHTTLCYTISDLRGAELAHVRVEAKDMELLEIREIGHGLVCRRSDSKVEQYVDKTRGVALLEQKVIPSDVYFPDASKLTALEADITSSLRGGSLAQHEVPGYKQQFFGSLSEGRLKGRVIVKTSLVETPHTAEFPFTEEVPEEIKPYLAKQPGIESDSPGIINKARELTWRAENAFQACRRLTDFVSNEIENGVSLPSARQTMETGVGNGESKALLLAALARTQNLPTRVIGGLIYERGDFTPHHWTEIWLGPDEGWTPFDPTTNETGFINASHIALWESGDLQTLAVTVRKFAPHPPRKVASFGAALSWPVGEKRTYSIYKDGKKIGQEIAYMRDMEVVNKREVFHLDCDTTLTDGKEEQHLHSNTVLDSQGLPLRFSAKTGDSEKPAVTQMLFEKDQIIQEIPTTKGEPRFRRIPFSHGTYLADQRFLSQWALVMEQIPLDKPNVTDNGGDKGDAFSLHIFIPESLHSQELMLNLGDQDETVTLPDGSEKTVTTLETEKGMIFYLDSQNHVVKISIPSQNIEFYLEATEFAIE